MRAPNECPDPAELFEAASGNLSREQRMMLLDHVAQCAECTEAWRIAMELGARPVETKFSASNSPKRISMMPSRRLAIAASAVLTVGVGTYLGLSMRNDAPQYRDAAELPAPTSQVTGSLPRDRFVLRWSPGPPGSTYSVRLSTADLAMLLEQENIAGSEFTVPASALAQVKSGDRLLWQVELHLPNGQRIASETQVVSLQ
jgi:hypothetical protein